MSFLTTCQWVKVQDKLVLHVSVTFEGWRYGRWRLTGGCRGRVEEMSCLERERERSLLWLAQDVREGGECSAGERDGGGGGGSSERGGWLRALSHKGPTPTGDKTRKKEQSLSEGPKTLLAQEILWGSPCVVALIVSFSLFRSFSTTSQSIPFSITLSQSIILCM